MAPGPGRPPLRAEDGRPPLRAEDGRPPVRTFHARRGRLSAAMRADLVDLGARLGLPPGPLEPAAAFGRAAPLVVEVGCGHGAAALAYAAAHPEEDLLAVDVHTPGVARLLRAAADAGATNLRVVVDDAVDLLAGRVAPGSLAAVHAFFPDPWPKRAQRHRRLVRPDVVALLADRLAPGGRLLVATDDAGYAAQAVEVVGADGRFEGGAAARPAWRPVAGYEAKAVAAGRVVAELAWWRR